MSISSFICVAASLSSTSTEKSHRLSLLSAEVTAKTDSSLGSNWMDVIASVCQWIVVMASMFAFF